MSKKTLFAALVPLVLGACGGGGGGSANLSDAQVVSTLKASNIDYGNYIAGGVASGATNRWVTMPIEVFIPVPDASSADYATQNDLAAKARTAISTINRKLAGRVTLTEVSSAPVSGTGYLRVSYLTSYVPTGSTNYASFCANVATGPNMGNVVAPESSSGRFDQQVAWINLGNGHCSVSQDIVIHEFGHALGLGAHFEGFGDGDAISTAFWDVLATLYGNPVRTVSTALTVNRAAN